MGLISLLSAWWPTKAKPPLFAGVADYRRHVMILIEKRHPVEKVAADPVDPAVFTMELNDEVSTVDVANSYHYIVANPAENADRVIDRFVRSLTENPNAPVPDEIIVPVLRTSDYVASSEGAFLHEPLGADLVILYMADRPDSMETLLKAQFPERDLADMRKVAETNLRKCLPHVVADVGLRDGAFYSVDDNPMLAPSLILLDEFWASVAARFPGDVLIALPRKDQLFLFDAPDDSRVRADVSRLIDATFEENYNLLTPQLYARRGGRIVAVSDEDHA